VQDDEEADVGGEEGELTALEEEVLIAGLTDSEDMGPAVRAVHERGVSDKLVGALEELSAQRKSDILRACDQERALDMMRSVELMVTLKQQAALSESRLAGINSQLQSDGAELRQAEREVCEWRQCRDNLQLASHVLDESIAVMRLTLLVRQHLKNNKMHAAVKALQRLQSLGVQGMRARVQSRLLQQLVPMLAEEVKEEAIKDFNLFLSRLRTMSVKVGRALLEGTLQRRVHEEEARQSATRRLNGSGTLPVLTSRAGGGDEDVVTHMGHASGGGTGADEEGEGVDYQVCGIAIDMGPLFRSLYLFRKLGQVHQLRAHLRSLRRQHALVDLSAPPLRARDTDASAAVRAYLEKVLGFFVLDQSMCVLSAGAFPRTQTEQEWFSQSSEIVILLSEACEVAGDSATLVQMRSIVWLFCGALESYNLSTRAIRASIDAQLPRYLALLMEEGRQDVEAAVRKDSLQALSLDNAIDYARIIVDLGLESYLHPLQAPCTRAGDTAAPSRGAARKGSKLAEPVTMIFSSSVPRLIQISKNLVFDLASFVDVSSATCVAVLVQALDQFLQEVVIAQLLAVLQAQDAASPSKAVKGAKTKLSTANALQAMQISLNAHILAQEAKSLMRYAASLCLLPDESHAASAAAERSARAFDQVKLLGEDKMFGHAADTVQDIMNLGDSEFDWAPHKVETQASNYMLQLSSYLMATFPAFSALPAETREALYYITCKSIASRYLPTHAIAPARSPPPTPAGLASAGAVLSLSVCARARVFICGAYGGHAHVFICGACDVHARVFRCGAYDVHARVFKYGACGASAGSWRSHTCRTCAKCCLWPSRAPTLT